jgi:hypothetical protein
LLTITGADIVPETLVILNQLMAVVPENIPLNVITVKRSVCD